MKAKLDFQVRETDRIASTKPTSGACWFANGNPAASVQHAATRGTGANTLAWLGLLFGACLFSTRAADLFWTNASGGAWNSPSNWSPNQLPAAGDRVWITNSGTYTVTISGGGVAGELWLGGATGTQTLSLTSGTWLVGNGTGNTNGVLRITGGTLGGGSLVLAGPLNWSGGSITNTLRCGGGTISGSANKTLRYGCLVNTGLLTFSNGFLDLYNGAVISNVATAVFDITADCYLSYYAGSQGTIYNTGLFRKSSGPGGTSVGARFSNDRPGTILVQSGSLTLRGGGTYSGTLSRNYSVECEI